MNMLIRAGVSASLNFGLLFSGAADGFIHAQPLFVPAPQLTCWANVNVVHVATLNNSVYAFEAGGSVASGSERFGGPVAIQGSGYDKSGSYENTSIPNYG